MFCLLAVASLIVELLVGYPGWLYRVIGHPVTWIGATIAWLDRRANDSALTPSVLRLRGAASLTALIIVVGALAFGLQWSLGSGPFGFLIIALLASSLLAQQSLASHVAAVADGLEQHGVAGGRRAVSQIVGRDPEALDEAGISRAAIESLAENFSDGVIAPAFWLAIAGLPGAAIYKTANTADSMIGHVTPKHRYFGWAAARFDDLINLPASRLTASLLVAAAWATPGASAREAWRAIWRDARRHRSPNAGWPEAAMAGALGLALAGPRSYGGVLVDDGFMGTGGRREANAADIRKALRLYWTADILMVALIGVGAALAYHLG